MEGDSWDGQCWSLDVSACGSSHKGHAVVSGGTDADVESLRLPSLQHATGRGQMYLLQPWRAVGAMAGFELGMNAPELEVATR